MYYKINYIYGHMFYFNEHMFITASSFEEALKFANSAIPSKPGWAKPYLRIIVSEV